MADSVPAVLCRLAQHGVAVQWRDGKAVFSAKTAPPPEIVALIDARKVDVSAFLHPDPVQDRLDAKADLLQSIEDARPSDVSDARWEEAMGGLRSFIADGYGDEALRCGWSRIELFRVPGKWANVSECGHVLLFADHQVVEVTAAEIKIRTSSGSIQVARRNPPVDYAVAFEAHLKASRDNYDPGSEEPKLRAFESVVLLFRNNNPKASIEDAKAAVRKALSDPQERA